ncbi:mechanosensitive ion channel family protein [Neolewinella lacunae]|uniref:Mechanosensitive ion channel family protein n=1 Tax=Neolewinella lacunae TaxID=1517758 RepID=A0A923PPB3_9BACT|nr:mechanosensitive ion channel family protein [Neolewinella lacunae]MBC6994923.1 mechanosensitive ion channel family protein [Neolewinella lacunae]MDN3633498.1 mechanosensitive ion channel family protein [Neolewinella lacunae]
MLLFEIFGLTFDFQPLFDELNLWWASLLKHLPNILLALLVGVFGFLATKFLKRYFHKLSSRLVGDETIARLLSATMTIALVIFFILLILSVLELSGAVQTLLASAGVVGLALGLAFQDPILNFFSGILLTVRKLFRVGDLIEIDGYFGRVVEITLRHTSLETLQGQDVMIPNKIVAQMPLTNYNKLGRRRVDLSCGVSYGDDLAKVKEVTIAAIREHVVHDEARDVELFFNEFGDSSINYTLRFWLPPGVSAQGEFLKAQSNAIMAIVSAYNANDIMIPFPIRTLDFGIKGGEKLSTVLRPAFSAKEEKTSSEKGGTEHAPA